MLKISNGTRTSNGLTGTYNDGILEYNGTASATSSTFTNTTNNILSAGTYTFSIDKPINVHIRLRLKLEDNTTQDITIYSGSTSVTFTLTQNATSNYIFIYNLTIGTAYNNTISIQLEEGSTATSFVEHEEQVFPLTLGNIELCKIGDYQDYFYKASNKWYLHKEISKRVFNGTEAWYSDGQENKKRKRLDNVLDGVGVVSSNIAKILSNLYRAISADNTYTGNTGIALSITGNTILIYDSNYNTAESTASFKQMLSNNNLILYYALATPTDTEITDTTLISQLEAISNAISYEEQTNISGSSDGSNPIFTVQAYKSLNKELNNKLDEEDLTDYVKNTDYASSSKGGVIKANSFYATYCGSDGFIQAIQKNYSEYLSSHNASFIGKGTLENVITGKQLINQTQLEESQEELFDVYDYSFIKNTSNNIFTTTENDTVQDKIFSIATGELSGNTYQNYLAFINYIEIKSNKNYYFALYNQNNTFNTLIGCIACFYDKNKNFISGLQISGTNQPIISPANAKYLRISISKTYYTNFKFLVSEDSYPQTYSDYFEKYYTLNKKLLINYNDIVVDVNGSGDFTTIQQAFDYIENKKDNNYHNRYNVYIKEGNYDLGANFSNEDLNNSNVSGVTVPDYTYLIGLGNKKNIVLYCTFNDKQQYISTLNLKGSCGLENITVIGTKTRYAIHVDRVQSSEYHQLIKNCIIKGIDTYYSVVYGTGTYDNAYWEFSDTIFDGTETGNNGGSGIPFTVHNSLNASGNRFIKFTNCRFKTNSTNKNAILFKTLAYRPNNPSESANNMVTYVEIYGCKFGGNGFSLVEENPTYYGTGCLYYITGYGNDNALYEIITTDGIDYSDRVDII